MGFSTFDSVGIVNSSTNYQLANRSKVFRLTAGGGRVGRKKAEERIVRSVQEGKVNKLTRYYVKGQWHQWIVMIVMGVQSCM